MTEIHRTHNVATGEIVEKPLTAKEIAENKVMQDLLETGLAIAKEKELSRQVLLDKLGISADEAKLLLS
jgi:hypothetical protein